jgi:predicted nucleic acid-binding protein
VKYLLDTSWVIEHLRGNPRARELLPTYYSFGLGLSAVSLAELYQGAYLSVRQVESETALEEFLRLVTVIDVTKDVAEIYGRRRSELLKQGRALGALDMLIAATALSYGLTVLTADSDFQRVAGLRIESLPLTP